MRPIKQAKAVSVCATSCHQAPPHFDLALQRLLTHLSKDSGLELCRCRWLTWPKPASMSVTHGADS